MSVARQDQTRHDEMRIGDVERDAVMVALHDHFAAGRLDRAELDERLDAVLSAKTRGDLSRLVRDLPEPERREPSPREGAAVMFGGPWNPAWHHQWHMHQRHVHQRRMAHHHRGMPWHHRRHGPFPAFPLLLAVFLVLAFTVGPGAGLLAVLQIGLAVWIVRAAVLAYGARRPGGSA